MRTGKDFLKLFSRAVITGCSCTLLRSYQGLIRVGDDIIGIILRRKHVIVVILVAIVVHRTVVGHFCFIIKKSALDCGVEKCGVGDGARL